MIRLKEKWNMGITWREYIVLSIIMTAIGMAYGLIYWLLTMDYSWVKNLKHKMKKPDPGRCGW